MLDGLPAFVFLLHGTYYGDAYNNVARLLKARGVRVGGRFISFGKDVNLPYLRHGCLFSPDHPSAAELEQAAQFGRAVAKEVTIE